MFQLLTFNKTIENLWLDFSLSDEVGDASGVSGLQDRIAARYGGLSERLQQAADYVLAQPVDVATRSLRSISSAAGLAPATFTRLARSLDFENYEEMREMCRAAIDGQAMSFSQKASLLMDAAQDQDQAPFILQHMRASVDNLDGLARDIDHNRLGKAVENLSNARNVVLYGAFSSTGIVEYFAYLARYFAPNWSVAGRMGASLSTAMVDLGPNDAVVILTKTPYAKRAVLAAQMASELGAYVILITDSHACPALEFASVHFIVPTQSPQFFSSYVPTLVLIETLVGMLVARAGPDGKARIEEVETRNHRYGEFWEQ